MYLTLSYIHKYHLYTAAPWLIVEDSHSPALGRIFRLVSQRTAHKVDRHQPRRYLGQTMTDPSDLSANDPHNLTDEALAQAIDALDAEIILTEDKLDAAHTDVDRLDDLLGTLDDRLRELQKESARRRESHLLGPLAFAALECYQGRHWADLDGDLWHGSGAIMWRVREGEPLLEGKRIKTASLRAILTKTGQPLTLDELPYGWGIDQRILDFALDRCASYQVIWYGGEHSWEAAPMLFGYDQQGNIELVAMGKRL